MAKQTITVSDLTGQPVDDSDAVEVLVLEAPGLKRPVRLDVAAGDVAGLDATAKPLLRLRIDGQDVTVEEARFRKLIKSGRTLEEILNEAEPSAPSTTRRAGRKTASKTTATRSDSAAIREWARGNGWPDLGNRGRIPEDAVTAYNAAN